MGSIDAAGTDVHEKMLRICAVASLAAVAFAVPEARDAPVVTCVLVFSRSRPLRANASGERGGPRDTTAAPCVRA